VRRLTLQAVFSIAILTAGPFLGGGQAWAGFVGMGALDSNESRPFGLPSTTCFASWSDTLIIASVDEDQPLGPTFADNRLEVAPGPGSVSQHESLGLFDSVFFSFLLARLPHGSTAVAGEGPGPQPSCPAEPINVHRPQSTGLLSCPLQLHLPAPPLPDLFQPPRGR
jgi:hypothetical protein